MRACLLFVTACGRLEFGATGDGGVDDDGVSATDDTSDSGAPAYMCPALKYKLCDELDTPTLGSLWTTTIGSVTRDTNIVHRGASSLRLSMPQTQPMAQTAAYIEHFSAWIQNATEVWVRGWFRVSAIPLSTNALEVISVEHNGGIGDYVFLRSTDTEVYSQAASQNAGAGAPVPVDTWFCLRFHVVFSAFGAGSLTLTSDVVPSVSLTNVDTRTASPMDFITFGPFFAPNNADVLQPAFDVWVDDVIADDSIAPTCDD